MTGPTWADMAREPAKYERRDFTVRDGKFNCPFCKRAGKSSLLKKYTGHRCYCGALFSQQQALALHYKGGKP